MKKAFALAGVIDNRQQLTPELETRLAAIEARIEKFDPTPKLETLQPYPVGSNVYSISDLEGRHPLVVRGYDRPGHILVMVTPNDPERSLPLKSVRPLDKCPRAQPSPSQRFANVADQTTREFLEGREAARIAATTVPFDAPPPLRTQRRYE
jgi:hypothetical protein